ncbi:PhnD/SsuA/transferrin family substrate-binding protein [soil metagenome]
MTLALATDPSPPAARDATRTAALSMYDLPELQAANDALWSAIAGRLTAASLARVPRRLSRAHDPDVAWSDPDLLLSQTCGYPLVTRLGDKVRIVATPGYDVEGCDGPRHRSALIVREDSPAAGLADLRGHRCALNDHASNSGMNLLRDAIAPLADGRRFFSDIVVTGSHEASIEAVVRGEADLAAIDCVTLHHLRQFRPELTHPIRILGWTRSTPGLPLITGAATTPAELSALRAAFADAFVDQTVRPALRTLRIKRFHVLPLAAYDQVRRLAQSAALRGYPELV